MAVVLSIIGVLVFFGFILLASAVRVLREYERGVIFRLGRLIGPKGPGLIFLIPIIDRMVRVDLRTVTLNVPPQEVITRDNVPVSVNAVCYFRVVDPTDAVVQIENFLRRDVADRADNAARGARPAPSSTRCCPSATSSTTSSRRSSTSRPSPGASR